MSAPQNALPNAVPNAVPNGATGSEALRIAGYAALFGVRDHSGDTIRKGAFARTLRERTASGAPPLPLYWQHRADQQIGWVEAVAEDVRGLRVIARIDAGASRAAADLARRAISGLSFGYRARSFRRDGAGRLLHAIDLFEVSLVTHPMQHGARVHLVR